MGQIRATSGHGQNGLWADPFHDIAMDHNGCWRWNTAKPQMHACIRIILRRARRTDNSIKTPRLPVHGAR